jgi:hypothetical protein
MDLEELQALLRQLPEVFEREAIPGLQYRPW